MNSTYCEKSPPALCADYKEDRLYWVDAMLKQIDSVDLDGSERRTVLSGEGAVRHPFAITVFEVMMMMMMMMMMTAMMTVEERSVSMHESCSRRINVVRDIARRRKSPTELDE